MSELKTNICFMKGSSLEMRPTPNFNAMERVEDVLILETGLAVCRISITVLASPASICPLAFATFAIQPRSFGLQKFLKEERMVGQPVAHECILGLGCIHLIQTSPIYCNDLLTDVAEK